MYFKPESASAFVTIFEKHRDAIRKSPGCTHLELLQDADNPLCYATWSHWENAEALEAYRQSPLFKDVWTTVKPLFGGKPEAFTLRSNSK